MDQWPSYLAYVTSFITIGGLWLAHHGIFRRLASADAMVMRLNILLLMLVSFLPFPTKLVAETINRTAADERAAVIFYGLVLLTCPAVGCQVPAGLAHWGEERWRVGWSEWFARGRPALLWSTTLGVWRAGDKMLMG